MTHSTLRPPRGKTASRRRKRKRELSQPNPVAVIHRMVENNLIRKVSYTEYRRRVRDVYDGPRGAFLTTASTLSLHLPLGEYLFKKRTFDLRGARRIVDMGCGAGQLAQHLLKYADPEAEIFCCDLATQMLRRARRRLKSPRPRFVSSDLYQMPFADASIDCITCGYVLEHLPEAADGLREASRILRPGGRMLLLTTEDTISGALTSRLWCCRTYNRAELRKICDEVGLPWHKELWFTGFHRATRSGGICVELRKP